jgi:ketosteroid isomerase-like protein
MTASITPDARTAASVTLIGDIYAAFGRGDVSFIATRLAPDTTWDFSVRESPVPWHRPAAGHEGVSRFLSDFSSNVELHGFQPNRFFASGDDVIVHLSLDYTVLRTGRRVREDQLQWWTVVDGRVTRLRHFEDTAQVIAAWSGT